MVTLKRDALCLPGLNTWVSRASLMSVLFHKSLLTAVVLSMTGAVIAQTGGLPTNVGAGVSRIGTGVPVTAVSAAQQDPQLKATVQNQVVTAPNRSAPMPSPMPSPLLSSGPNLINEVIDQTVPLTAAEVRTLRRELDVRKAALTENVTGRAPVRLTTSIYNLDLSPGATPPVVRIEIGNGSIISFLDSAGRPWPAKVADNFSPNGLTLSQFTEHQLSIGTTSPNPLNAGVAVALEGLPVAITFSVITGQPVVDSQVHMIVPQYRNGTPPGVGSLRGEPSLTAGDLMSYLLRTPPASSKKLTVEGLSGAMAWQISPDRMVIRTSATVTTGAFRVQGIGDGTYVYEIPLSPQIRVVQGDRFNTIRISGFTNGGQ